MNKDQLFLLPGWFADPSVGTGAFHCIECARVEGLLSYQPALRARLEVRYVEHARPRNELIELLGEPYQNLPTLVVASPTPAISTLVQTSSITGRSYCTGVEAVTAYLVAVHSVSSPHP
jgi:hypothetical protein